MDIGIDLGTTFSVMAVKGQVEMAPGYPRGEYLGNDRMDVTILPDLDGNYLIPSVMWWEPDPEDPNDPTKGTYTFGVNAKQLAEEGKAPIMFSKRSIGTDEKLMLNGRAFTAKEVAMHFLRYMKETAEEVTGQKIDRVIVTHPAYFLPNQVMETMQAAQEAGFDIAPKQMMMEPCAAAMAFTINDARGICSGDALRVLTYDLGGGTFDVAVMEKIEGVIQMKKFEGNHLLGGYDFDKALVQWILDQLKAQGRVIPFDDTNPEHTGCRARMLQVAEGLKIKISEQRTPKARVPVKVSFLHDDKGKPVQFSGGISREEFSALIQEPLWETIDCCRRALAAIDLKTENLDAVLLVGGSTYGQWVQEVVNQEFGVSVEPFAPDYCVAAGAALMVAQLPPLAPKNERIELVLDYQTASVLLEVNIGGTLRPSPGSDLAAEACRGLQVLLIAPNGKTLGPEEISDDGKFLFRNVKLEEEEPSRIKIEVSENGKTLLVHEGTITYTPDRPPLPPPVLTLPRPLYLKADRMVSMAEEGAPLPAKCEVRLKLVFYVPSLQIPIFMESEQIGIIDVQNIPEEVGEGCLVIVNAEVTQDNEMRGRVQILGPSGNAVKEDTVRVGFPPIVIPDEAILRGNFDELKDRLDQEILQAPAQDRARLAGPGKKLLKQIEKLLSEQQPDRQILHEKIKALERLVNPPPDDMNPPRKNFESIIAECRMLLASAPENPATKAMESQLTKIENTGKEACITKNHKRWAQACETLNQHAARIEKAVSGGDSSGPPPKTPETPVLKASAIKQVQALRSALNSARDQRVRDSNPEKWFSICAEFFRRIDKMESEVGKIVDNEPSEQALAKIQSYLSHYEAIHKKIQRISEGTAVEV